MNSLGLIYRELGVTNSPDETTISSANNVFKTIRHHIKPQFSGWKLKANNLNGQAARDFNRKLGRFKSDWLDFEILDFKAPDGFFLVTMKLMNLTYFRTQLLQMLLNR